jgi:hypothetical protein
MGGFGSEEGKN